jgi:hypothetical protein
MTTPDLGTTRGFNFVPALLAVALFAFGGVEAFDFLHSWHSAERGLLIFEKACPIYATGHNKS